LSIVFTLRNQTKKRKKRKKEKSISRDYNPKIAIINSNKYHLRFIQINELDGL